MTKITGGALVIYKTRPALVVQISGDKIELRTANGESKSVRNKDIELLHPGNGSVMQPLPPPPVPVPNAEELLELIEGDELSFAEFTELAYGAFTPATAYAAYELVAENIFFSGSPSAGVKARQAAEIAASLSKRNEKEAETLARQAFLERVRTGAITAEDHRLLRDVEQVALGRAENSRTLRELGIAPMPEKAHALLLTLGVWSLFTNPWPERYAVETDDPAVELPQMPNEERVDLTNQLSLAIDDADSHDPDDAVSYADGLLWVHVADPAAVVLPGSPADDEAMHRGANLYLPERVSHMLPTAATDRFALGLTPTSPAISFAIRIDDNGDATLEKMMLSVIRATRYNYDDAQEHWETTPLKELRPMLERFRERRAADGALLIDLPEVKIRVAGEEVKIVPVGLTPARELVANAMLACGAAVAKYAQANDIPMPYTVQPPPDTDERGSSLSAMYALRKSCQTGVTSSTPGRHSGLALEPYCRVTSPLRRYGDLLAHQQLRRVIAQAEPFSAEYIDDRIAGAEPGAMQRRKLERQSNEFWTLVYLTQHPEWQSTSVLVARQDERLTFMIPELAYEYKNRFGGRVELGDAVTVKTTAIDTATMSVRFQILT